MFKNETFRTEDCVNSTPRPRPIACFLSHIMNIYLYLSREVSTAECPLLEEEFSTDWRTSSTKPTTWALSVSLPPYLLHIFFMKYSFIYDRIYDWYTSISAHNRGTVNYIQVRQQIPTLQCTVKLWGIFNNVFFLIRKLVYFSWFFF